MNDKLSENFFNLCEYFTNCVRYDDNIEFSLFVKQFRPNYIEISNIYDIDNDDSVLNFVTNINRRYKKHYFYLGYPILVRILHKKSTNQIYHK